MEAYLIMVSLINSLKIEGSLKMEGLKLQGPLYIAFCCPMTDSDFKEN